MWEVRATKMWEIGATKTWEVGATKAWGEDGRLTFSRGRGGKGRKAERGRGKRVGKAKIILWPDEVQHKGRRPSPKC